MKVLILCEYSGIIRDAFTRLGHDAISCDILPTESPGEHYQGDAFDMLNEDWDLIIAHPPCTALSVSGNSTYAKGKDKHYKRIEAAKWTEKLWLKCIERSDHICFENPVGVLPTLTKMPKPNYVQPWQFGHKEQKKTGLFLYGLNPLKETSNVYKWMMLLPKNEREANHYMSPSEDRGKLRSLTYQGIAEAMSDQRG